MRIGLTGGIGSGKSTVAAILVEHGATLVDTDAIARQLTLPGGAAMPAVEQVFGASTIGSDGGLDRAAMRALVFSDASAKQRLEAILHPMIGAEAARLAQAAPGAVVFDVPLLAALGAWLGWQMILPVVLGASVLGAGVGLAMKSSGALREGRYVPFGPFLAGSGVVVLLAGSGRVLGWLGWA